MLYMKISILIWQKYGKKSEDKTVGRKIDYPEQEKTLYLWDLRLNGQLVKHEIHNYRINNFPRDTYYLFRTDNSTSARTVRDYQLDRFVNNRVCSFNNDDKNAYKIIEDSLNAKAKKLLYDYENISKMLELVRSCNPWNQKK